MDGQHPAGENAGNAGFRTPAPEEVPWLPLASEAMAAAQHRDRAGVDQILRQLFADYGYELVPQLLLCWVDTALHCHGLDVDRPGAGPIGLGGFVNHATGAIEDVDSVPPNVAWVGRFMTARCSNDRDTVRALIASVTSDEQWTQNVLTTLDICSSVLPHLPWRGAACG